MTNPVARWNIALWVRCPHCEEMVDLLSNPGFWSGRDLLQPGAIVPNIEVPCPNCHGVFHTDLTTRSGKPLRDFGVT